MTDNGEHLRIVAHELGGHALTARSLGYRVRTVSTRRTVPGAPAGWVDHVEVAETFAGSVDKITILLAGEVGELLLRGQIPSGYWHDVDGDELLTESALTAALHLMDDQLEAGIIYMLQTDGRPGPNDRENAEREALAAAGEERAILLSLCAARARRIVAANAALAIALFPDVMLRPLLTGAELETLIAAQTAEGG